MERDERMKRAYRVSGQEDHDAAALHLRVVKRLLRQRGQAETPVAEAQTVAEWDLPPVEDWVMEDAPADPMAALGEGPRRATCYSRRTDPARAPRSRQVSSPLICVPVSRPRSLPALGHLRRPE